jgi:uncharacterized membrane protein
MRRRAYLDWLRGVAVIIMMFWHAMDAWTAAGARHGQAFYITTFIGGWAAPLFLFLAGVSIPFSRSPIRRGWQVLALAFVFRLQSFVLNPGAPWTSMLKPDILNILGIGIVLAGFAWSRTKSVWDRSLWLGIPTALFILLAPWSRSWHWPGWLGDIATPLEGYIRPVSGVGGFSIFPWLAFIFAGAYVGSLIPDPRPAGQEPQFHARLGIAGVALLVAGYAGSFFPSPFARSEFWTTSLSFFLMRLGAMTAAITLGWLWMRRREAAGEASPLVLFGRTSLFVYWVHVELAYGFASWPLHGALPFGWALVAFAVLTLTMFGAAVLWTRRRRPMIPEYLKPAVAKA